MEGSMGNRRKSELEKQSKVHVAAADTDRVVVSYLHPGQVSAYFCESLTNLLMWDQATSRRIVGCVNLWSSANISSPRNSLVQQFLERDAEWLLMVDADMAFPHNALDELLAVADAVERPIMGGLCFGATFGQLFPTIYYFAEDDQGRPTTQRVRDYPLDSVIQCAATGAAFVLIHRRVFEAIAEHGFNPTFPWYQETELAGQPSGEDITFCLRAGIVGIPVHVNTAVKIGHHKSTVLDHDTFQAQKVPSQEASP